MQGKDDNKLTQEKLLQGIRELQDPVVHRLAATVAILMKAENGLESALKFLESQFRLLLYIKTDAMSVAKHAIMGAKTKL